MGANATTFVPAYVSGEVLTAADLNVTNSGVPVFASTTTRDAAFGGAGEKTLAEGQLCYVENLTGAAQIQYYDGAAWTSLVPSGVVQVKSVTKTDTFTTTSVTFVDLTGLSLSITPTSASNKILAFYDVQCSGVVGVNMGGINLVRNSTAICQADAAGVRSVASSIVPELVAAAAGQVANSFLDSPATTSATTYKLQIRSGSSGQTIFVNRTNSDTDNVVFFRGTSTLTIMEVTP